MSYIQYRFDRAIHSLFDTDLPRREWLTSHHVYHLLHLDVEDIPKEIQREFRRFKRDLTMEGDQGVLGSLDAIVSSMDESDVDRIIGSLIMMHGVIQEHETILH